MSKCETSKLLSKTTKVGSTQQQAEKRHTAEQSGGALDGGCELAVGRCGVIDVAERSHGWRECGCGRCRRGLTRCCRGCRGRRCCRCGCRRRCSCRGRRGWKDALRIASVSLAEMRDLKTYTEFSNLV